MILAVSLVILLFASDASCQTAVTYNSKSSEELLCPITDQIGATWSDETTAVTTSLATYLGPDTAIQIPEPGPKHRNFNYNISGTSFSLFIQNVEAEDGGAYRCTTLGTPGSIHEHNVVVEVIPGTLSLNCFVPPDVTCPEQVVNPPSELVCVCAANGVRPGTLYLDIPDAHTPQQNESIENGDLFDLRLKATVPVTESMAEVTCSVKGYNTSEPVPSELITTTFIISPPTCSLDVSFDHKCTEATLNCSCTGLPTAGESPSDDGIVYSYFNGTGHIIESESTTTSQTNDVEGGAVNTYSCRGCNGIYYGENSYVTQRSECTISTTALPTTTITTVPLSTNEPTSTKAMVTTTEEPKDDNPKNPESSALGAGAIVGISLGVVAVVIVIVVIAVIMCKKGEDDSKPSDDKPDDNGAGPGKDPEIPAYGVIDKNRTKDPTPAPRSSMRDSKNPSKPKQDGPMEMKYADLDHGNKPPSDEVRKPKEEPTEYATVQPVIV